MYNEQSITALEKRIGWEKPLDTDFAIDLDEEVLTADSGRKVNSFHQLVTVENVYAAVQPVNMEAADFNGFLTSVRKQAVLEVLTLIFDKHEDYIEVTDYSVLIETKTRLFDDAIGYCIAVKMLELFISTSRINLQERNAKMSFNSLKIELEGAKNDNGHFIAKGIVYYKNKAIKDAQKIIFPNRIIVQNGKAW